MVVGFTGTRGGMTPAQRRVVIDLLGELSPHTVVHGDCTGADADFHDIVKTYSTDCKVILRPGHNDRGSSPTRAYCEVSDGDVVHPVEPYLVRDEKIVLDSDVLIACPATIREVRRSGTWATIRKSRKHGVSRYIVGPNGKLID